MQSPSALPARVPVPKSASKAGLAASTCSLLSQSAAGRSTVSKNARNASAEAFWVRAPSLFMGGRLVEVYDLLVAHVLFGLVPGDLADLAHDLGHALGLAVND